MKTIVLNASPRKNWNTAKLLKSAVEGALTTGAEVEYIDLYDLNFTGCRSCMLCKRKNVERINNVLKEFINLLGKYEILDSNGVYKAIGAIKKKDSSGLKIGSYWSEYDASVKKYSEYN